MIGKKLQAIMHNLLWLNVKCSKETECGYSFSWGNTWELSVLWTLNTLWWHLKYSYPETSVTLSYLLKNSLGICSSRFINFGKAGIEHEWNDIARDCRILLDYIAPV